MTDLYTLTRKLVERGCPEHERLRFREDGHGWVLYDSCNVRWISASDPDARAIWTCHAAEHFKIDTTDINIILQKTEHLDYE